MVAALNGLIRMQDQSISMLLAIASGCYHNGTCPRFTGPVTNFPQKAGSGADILKAALNRVG
jgi:hypothetical protein